jgi:hypothetical protein
MELRLGKMTGHELAEWFNVSYNASYRKKTKKYQAILSNFCEFTPYRGGVEITEVYCPYYIKNMNCIDDKNFLEEIKRCEREQDGLASIAGVAEYWSTLDEYKGLNENQIRYRATKAAKRLFGTMSEGKSAGPAGTREYEWAVKLTGLNWYRHMTADEHALFNSYTIEWNSKHTPEEIQRYALLDSPDEFFRIY